MDCPARHAVFCFHEMPDIFKTGKVRYVAVNRVIATLLFALFLTAAAPAQAETIDLTIDSTIATYGRIVPLGTTANNNVVVFYESGGGGYKDIFARVVRPSGALGPVRKLVEDIVQGQGWQAVWHPRARRFLLVYRRDDRLYACPAKRNGKPGDEVLIEGSQLAYPQYGHSVAWTGKDRFILFFQQDGQLVKATLSKDGRTLGKPATATSFADGVAYCTGSTTEDDGSVVAYCMHYDEAKKIARLFMLRIGDGADAAEQVDLGLRPRSNSVLFATDISGAYDPATKTHSIAYRIGLKRLKYCTFLPDGTMLRTPVITPDRIPPGSLVSVHRIPQQQRFAMFYYKLDYDDDTDTDYVDFRIFTYKPDGTVVAPARQLKHLEAANGCGCEFTYSRDGNIFVAYRYGSQLLARMITTAQ